MNMSIYWIVLNIRLNMSMKIKQKLLPCQEKGKFINPLRNGNIKKWKKQFHVSLAYV